jgi:hypothetical protein
MVDAYVDGVEWQERKMRADVAHDKLLALGYRGSERTANCAVEAKVAGTAGDPPGAPAVGCPSPVSGSSGTTAPACLSPRSRAAWSCA